MNKLRQQMSKAVTTFLPKGKTTKLFPNQADIVFPGLRIERFESPRSYKANGASPDPPNPANKMNIPEEIEVIRSTQMYTKLLRQMYDCL